MGRATSSVVSDPDAVCLKVKIGFNSKAALDDALDDLWRSEAPQIVGPKGSGSGPSRKDKDKVLGIHIGRAGGKVNMRLLVFLATLLTCSGLILASQALGEDAGAVPGPPAASPPSLKKARCSKRQHELDVSEQIVLRAKQMLKSVQQSEAVSITDKKVAAMLQQVKDRLKPSCVELYAQDYDPSGPQVPHEDGAGLNGMSLLQELQDVRILVNDLRADTHQGRRRIPGELNDHRFGFGLLFESARICLSDFIPVGGSVSWGDPALEPQNLSNSMVDGARTRYSPASCPFLCGSAQVSFT